MTHCLRIMLGLAAVIAYALLPRPSAASTVGLLGDSITAGCCAAPEPSWAEHLAARHPDWQVSNYGVSGTTADNWQPGGTLYAQVAFPVDVAVVSLGTVDLNPATMLPVEAFALHLKRVTDALQRDGAGLVCVATTFDSPAVQSQPDVHLRSHAFRQHVLSTYGCTVDLFGLPEGSFPVKDDGHPGALGHDEIAKRVAAAIVVPEPDLATWQWLALMSVFGIAVSGSVKR